MMTRDVNEFEVAKVARCRREQSLPRHAGPHGRPGAGGAGRLHPLPQTPELPRHRNQRADHRAGPLPGSFRPTTASFGSTSTPISPAAPTWSSTGTGPPSTPVRRLTGRACCRTTSNRTAPTPRCPAPRTNFRRSARTSSISRSKMRWRFSTASTRPTRSTSCRSRWRRRAWSFGKPVGGLQHGRQAAAPRVLRGERRRGLSSSPKTRISAPTNCIIVPPLYIADDALLTEDLRLR